MLQEDIKKNMILVTEDNDDHFLLTREAFCEAQPNYLLKRVRDGEELINYLKKSKIKTKNFIEPSLIILDLNMPRKDGRETLKEIRNLAGFTKLPVVILTNSNHEIDSYVSKKYGAQAYYRKPMYFDQLVEILKEVPKFIKN